MLYNQHWIFFVVWWNLYPYWDLRIYALQLRVSVNGCSMDQGIIDHVSAYLRFATLHTMHPLWKGHVLWNYVLWIYMDIVMPLI